MHFVSFYKLELNCLKIKIYRLVIAHCLALIFPFTDFLWALNFRRSKGKAKYFILIVVLLCDDQHFLIQKHDSSHGRSLLYSVCVAPSLFRLTAYSLPHWTAVLNSQWSRQDSSVDKQTPVTVLYQRSKICEILNFSKMSKKDVAKWRDIFREKERVASLHIVDSFKLAHITEVVISTNQRAKQDDAFSTTTQKKSFAWWQFYFIMMFSDDLSIGHEPF